MIYIFSEHYTIRPLLLFVTFEYRTSTKVGKYLYFRVTHVQEISGCSVRAQFQSPAELGESLAEISFQSADGNLEAMTGRTAQDDDEDVRENGIKGCLWKRFKHTSQN